VTASTARQAPLSWRGLMAGALVAFAGVLLFPGDAAAAGPAVTVSPESGGPGTPMTITGSGFCGRAACGAVRLTMAGRQVGADQRPDSAGRFTAKTQAPGGLVPGEHEVVAQQVLDDGNEVSATASFVYTPSKGERAEREAETRDQVNNLVDPSAPTASPRGMSLADAAASAGLTSPASTSAPGSTPAGAEGGAVAQRSGRSLDMPVLLLVAAGVAALAAGGLWWRRRTLGGAS